MTWCSGVIAVFYTASINMTVSAYAGACALRWLLNLGGICRPIPYAAVRGYIAVGRHAGQRTMQTIAGNRWLQDPIRPKFRPTVYPARKRKRGQNAKATLTMLISSNNQACLGGDVTGDGVLLCRHRHSAWNTNCIYPSPTQDSDICAVATGIAVAFADLVQHMQHPPPQGVLAGPLVGKPLGIFASTWLAVKLGWRAATRPRQWSRFWCRPAGRTGFGPCRLIADPVSPVCTKILTTAKTVIPLALPSPGSAAFR
jgi:NhaA family Na+:H+ antiporter